MSWLPFKLDVYVSCCEALVNRGKILPSTPPTPRFPPRNVNFSRSVAVSSLSLFFFLQSHSVAALRGVYMALCSNVDGLEEHKKHWTGCEAEVFVCGGEGVVVVGDCNRSLSVYKLKQ